MQIPIEVAQFSKPINNEMIASVQARGHQPADDNEADAIALVYLARDRQTTQEV
jgi:hypothetical protein